MNSAVISPLKRNHNHRSCKKQALAEAKRICAERGERLTEIRQKVLALVWSSHEPVKAYDLLDDLKKEHPASKPVTVYRALDFLRAHGLVHKIESLNAYLGCGDPAQQHDGVFMICEKCGVVIELDSQQIKNSLTDQAESVGFSIGKLTLEISGVCQHCNK